MASELEKLFVEYTHRRKRGQDPQKAVLDLRPQIRALSDLQKQSLKLRMRKWEQEYMPIPAGMMEPSPALAPQPAIRRITVEDSRPAPVTDMVDVICHFCGRLNPPGETLCRGCGRLLDIAQQYDLATRVLRQTTDLFY
ncbi:MAG: hypothetical protein K8J31_11955, partial [Anaerolineae bacterium]|nr:hypothetical protein [Anaerolineae bacterium]